MALVLAGCPRKHVPVPSITELPYPACDAGSPELVAHGHLRSGPTMREKDVVERFEVTRTGCGYVFEGRQEWPLMGADVEVIYDESLTPLRAWKRMTLPGVKREDGQADIRLYELRTPEVGIKRRSPDGEILNELLKQGGRMKIPAGARPGAVIAPGRGVVTMWIRRAKLAVGGKSAELVLDFRDMVESLTEATLARDEDQYEPSLGKTVRVYTFFGRDTVFADENDVVIGDLAGLRPSDSLTTPEPAPMPTYGPPDPVHTP
jgi:hypothetical protein